VKEWEALALRLRPIFEKRCVLQAIVFGSLAREEATRRSDLDLLIVMDTQAHWLDRYDDILREVSQVIPNRDVDMLIYTPRELSQITNRPMIATALKEGKVIYESN